MKASLVCLGIAALASVGDGQEASPRAINKYGRVVGSASFAEGGFSVPGAVYWKDADHATTLDALLPPEYANSVAYGLNDNNLIVGIAQLGCGRFCWHNQPVS